MLLQPFQCRINERMEMNKCLHSRFVDICKVIAAHYVSQPTVCFHGNRPRMWQWRGGSRRAAQPLASQNPLLSVRVDHVPLYPRCTPPPLQNEGPKNLLTIPNTIYTERGWMTSLSICFPGCLVVWEWWMNKDNMKQWSSESSKPAGHSRGCLLTSTNMTSS